MSNPPALPVSKPVKVAVVGLGFMGTTHLRAYLDNPQAQVAAVCGVNRLPVNGVLPGVAGNIKKSDAVALGPDVKVYQKIEELLADPEIQLIDLCTPTVLHPQHAIAALNAGKYVLCEKPIARTSVAALEILTATDRASGFLMPAMCMRFWPGWSWLKQVAVENTYGKILAARFSRLSEMPAWGGKDAYGSDSGGALFDLHIHDTDFVNYLFGRPAGVFSSGVVGKQGAIDHVVTHYHYSESPVVHAEGSWLLKQGFRMSYTLHCEQATLDFDAARGPGALVIAEDGQPPRTVELEQTDGYAAEIRYFVECVRTHSAPQIVTAQNGVAALEICEAEEKSIRNGKFIDL
ncbi:MAG TPA: Gfo/Idh/MocA family oxidoreductase [Verrucomicrobiae bacterium]|jgi:predicted dehydrogenase